MSSLRLILILVLLASLDVAATVCIKQAAVQRNPLLVFVAMGLFVAVGATLYVCVEQADLTIVSLGWIVLFQAVIMVVDHRMYNVQLTWIQVTAIIVAMIAIVVAAINPASTSSSSQPVPRQRARHADSDGESSSSSFVMSLSRSQK